MLAALGWEVPSRVLDLIGGSQVVAVLRGKEQAATALLLA